MSERPTSQDSSEPLMHLGPVVDESPAREAFARHELATVLSHYELDVVTSIREFPYGSRRSPKLRISTRSGEYLLKRRAPGRDDPFRVAFAHELLLFLAGENYPVPRLFGTRDEHNSLLQLNGRTYELFEYVRGSRPAADARAAAVSGEALGRLHRVVAEFESAFNPPTGTYHGMDLSQALQQLPEAVRKADNQADADALQTMVARLGEAYEQANTQVESLGIARRNDVVVHGDWHPGNLLFRDQRVVAVLDFDSARRAPRVIDLANGALQFSMRTGPIDQPRQWPQGISHRRMRAMVQGYERGIGAALDDTEIEAIPWLIIEAMVVESVIPIAATGRFAHLPGEAFLTMVLDKVQWLRPRVAKLTTYLREGEEADRPA